MAVGLFDWDLIYWQQPTFFNLELMKMATYYRSHRVIIRMLDQINTQLYSEIQVRKDYEDYQYPSKVFNNPQIIVGGLALMAEKYIPLDAEIELLPPSPDIYERFGEYYQESRSTRYLFNSMLKGEHVRLSLDGETVCDQWGKQLNVNREHPAYALYVHDKDLANISGAAAAISNGLEKFTPAGRRVGLKYPIAIYDDDDFREWTAFKRISGTAPLTFMKPISDAAIKEFVDKRWNDQPLQYLLCPDWFTTQSLIHVFKQGMFLSSSKNALHLLIVEPELYDPLVSDTINLFNNYFQSIRNSFHKKEPIVTLYQYVKKIQKVKSIPIRQKYIEVAKTKGPDIFRYWYKEDYDLFKMFYECEEIIFEDDNFTQKNGARPALEGGIRDVRTWRKDTKRDYESAVRTYGPDGTVNGRVKPWYKDPTKGDF